MNQSQEAHTFLVVEGILHESMVFEPDAAYETRQLPAAVRDASGDGTVVAELLDGEGKTILQATPEVFFPSGCMPSASHPGYGRLSVVLASNPEAAFLTLRAYDRKIFEAAIGQKPPEVKNLELAVDAEKMNAEVQIVPPPGPDVALEAFLVVDDRRFPVPLEGKGGKYTVDLAGYTGLGKAQLCLRLTRDLRSSEQNSKAFELPKNSITGRILLPFDGEEWSPGHFGSLSGNLFDENGRRVDWGVVQPFWTMDGERLKDDRQTANCNPQQPGKYVIELRQELKDGKNLVLDQVSILVREPSKAQKRYEALVAEYLAEKDNKAN